METIDIMILVTEAMRLDWELSWLMPYEDEQREKLRRIKKKSTARLERRAKLLEANKEKMGSEK